MKTLIWGTGSCAERILKHLHDCEVIGFVESEPRGGGHGKICRYIRQIIFCVITIL